MIPNDLKDLYNRLKSNRIVESKTDIAKRLGYGRIYTTEILNGTRELTDDFRRRIYTVFYKEINDLGLEAMFSDIDSMKRNDIDNDQNKLQHTKQAMMTKSEDYYTSKFIDLLEDKINLLEQRNAHLEQLLDTRITTMEGSLNNLLKLITTNSSQSDAALAVVGKHLDTLAKKVTGIYEFLNSSGHEETLPSAHKKVPVKRAKA